MYRRNTGARLSATEAAYLKVKIAMMIKRVARCLAALSLLWALNSAVASGDVADKHACQEGAPRCTRFVLQEMERRFRRLAKDCDHNAIFSLIYLRTTE